MAYIVEGVVADDSDAGGDGDGGQAVAAGEGVVADESDAGGDGDGGQAAAAGEGIITNIGNGIGCPFIRDAVRNN